VGAGGEDLVGGPAVVGEEDLEGVGFGHARNGMEGDGGGEGDVVGVGGKGS
jgi:hypothetical protein